MRKPRGIVEILAVAEPSTDLGLETAIRWRDEFNRVPAALAETRPVNYRHLEPARKVRQREAVRVDFPVPDRDPVPSPHPVACPCWVPILSPAGVLRTLREKLVSRFTLILVFGVRTAASLV